MLQFYTKTNLQGSIDIEEQAHRAIRQYGLKKSERNKLLSDISIYGYSTLKGKNVFNFKECNGPLLFFFGLKLMGRYYGKIIFMDLIIVTDFSCEEEMLSAKFTHYTMEEIIDINNSLFDHFVLNLKYHFKIPRDFDVMTIYYTSGKCFKDSQEGGNSYRICELGRTFAVDPVAIPMILLPEDHESFAVYRVNAESFKNDCNVKGISRNLFIPEGKRNAVKSFFNYHYEQLGFLRNLVWAKKEDYPRYEHILKSDLCFSYGSYLIPYDSDKIVWKRDYSVKEV